MPDSLNSDSLNIAIAGLGTVGTGVVKIIQQNKVLLTNRSEKTINITAVSARDKSRDRGINISDYQWFDDPVAMVKDSDADIIVELIGGADGPAKAVCEAALEKGKHVVTANKALIAEHGVSLAGKAEEKNISLLFEAAVAGGIPIIKALSEGLSANKLSRICGILNGTCNYIVTEMEKNNEEFEAVLDVAQKKGFAEADPSFDIDGIDAAHKLSILIMLSFGIFLKFEDIQVEGIRNISPTDIDFADQLGYKIKLLAITKAKKEGLEAGVYPALVRKGTQLADVNGAFNAIYVVGDAVGPTMLYGMGAGMMPTASAVVGDIVSIAKNIENNESGIPKLYSKKDEIQLLSLNESYNKYYLRFQVEDRTGILGKITSILGKHGISIESVIQKGREKDGGEVPVIIMTHESKEKDLLSALNEIKKSDLPLSEHMFIRIEELN